MTELSEHEALALAEEHEDERQRVRFSDRDLTDWGAGCDPVEEARQ